MEEDRVEGSIEHSEEFVNECTPCIGMEFESEDVAYRFYCEYGRILGFCVRKDYISKSKTDGVTINRKFVCSKEGVKRVDKRTQTTSIGRLETRTNCKAFLYISLDRASLKWTVKRIDETHNHLLHILETVHMMRNQRGLTESLGITVEIAEATGLPLKLSHNLISAQSGGKENVGFMREDIKSYLRAKRGRDLQYGEAGALLRYFQKQTIDNPYFFHGMQLDVDEMITNIFWVDHEMIRDYGLFGDTLSFDTTFRTNKEFRPLAIFIGFNHFCMTVIFGVALMYDERIPSFVWLFKKNLEAMSGKKPFTFFTDQDQAMANAISQVMPVVKHRLCTFHINQNAMKHLGYLYGKESTFGSDFNACMFLYEDKKELEEAWKSLLESYNLKDNEWMNKTWELRRKWAHVYMKLSYNAGMRNTQLSESLNAKLKKPLKSNLHLDQVLTQLDKVVFDKPYNEKEAAHGSREKMVRLKYPSCPMLLHVSKLYTPPIFDLFHKELDIFLGCKVIQ
ncbi:protein FAR1-RELATED SEQUENCE 5-like [Rhododendron vialii]|uniref:protein FAR1-RELATED SEQUENCE 5-like n=1 Tax=Rhododendron vialii TaxID=182163 RepID=UPI00265E9BEB|nr:protein FAR1-RELATED SEQUENCE 5-like [Rhododendron vialii]